VNVEAQARSPSSLLNWMRRLIAMRQQHKALQSGTLRFLYPGNRKILAYLRESDGDAVLCVANLSHAAQAVELDLGRFKGRVPVEMLGRSAFPPIGELPYLVTLPAYGFHWFVLPKAAEMPVWHQEAPPPLPELITVVMREGGWKSVMAGREARQLESDVLPAYIAKQRWFSAKDDTIDRVDLTTMAELDSKSGHFLLLQAKVGLAESKRSQCYLLPLALSWTEDAGNVNWPLLPYTVARVRRASKLGALYEATGTDQFALAIVSAIQKNKKVPGEEGVMMFSSLPGLAQVELPDEVQVRRVGGEQSNSSAIISDKLVLKFYRRPVDGEHPEVEMCRFLTEVAGYKNTPQLLGTVEYVEQSGTKRALAVLQEFVRSQGDGWAHAVAYLDRVFDGLRLPGSTDEAMTPAERHAVYLEQIRTLGRRVAEMHRALAIETTDPDFAPESVNADDLAKWRERAMRQADLAFAALRNLAKDGTDDAAKSGLTQDQIRTLLQRRKECIDHIHVLTSDPVQSKKTRIHGDLHLGQVLVAKDDFQIIDFEGEPATALAERRAKSTPVRDVAGMLRSIEYVAWASLFRLADRDPEGFTRLLPFAMEWRTLVQKAFLESYQAAIVGAPSWPATAKESARLLNLFLLDKVLYEIGYEAASRPAWLPIPIAGLTELLDTLRHPTEPVRAAA
jgi:maltose alpha-D-glucosyltransferase / alpha-amylase